MPPRVRKDTGQFHEQIELKHDWQPALIRVPFSRTIRVQVYPPRWGSPMILKEKTSRCPTDKFGLAGYQAEKQMAFYLRRAFGEMPDVFGFNDLRFERNGEVAQITTSQTRRRSRVRRTHLKFLRAWKLSTLYVRYRW